MWLGDVLFLSTTRLAFKGHEDGPNGGRLDAPNKCPSPPFPIPHRSKGHSRQAGEQHWEEDDDALKGYLQPRIR